MPELPEVETTRCGIEPHVLKRRIEKVIVRQRQLRWPVPKNLSDKLTGQTISSVARRGKYLLLQTKAGTIILHLGMSGSLTVVDAATKAQKHDHIDIVFSGQRCLRLRDPRRFGAVLWTDADPLQHELLKQLGVEPLDDTFSGAYLYRLSRKRKQAVKQFLMNSHHVVGVGNIYASEALFLAGIRPTIAAGKISQQRYEVLAQAVKQVLRAAIKQGGTTLRDFTASDGKPGYFQLQLNVYAKKGQACSRCGHSIKCIRLGQRSTFYCLHCQK